MSDSYNGDDVYAILRQLEAAQAPAEQSGPAPSAAPVPTVTPALASISRPLPGSPTGGPQPMPAPYVQPDRMGPYAAGVNPPRPAGAPDGSLANRLRDTLSQDTMPSDGESVRQQLLALGAAMAASPQRSFGGALGEGVLAMQRHDQQQQTNRRQLLGTETEAQYRDAMARVQQARLALEEDPDSPENRARLMTAEANMMAARARMASAGSGSSRQQMVPGSYMANPDGTVSVVVQDRQGNLRTQPVPGMTRENMPGAEQRELTRQQQRRLDEDRDEQRRINSENRWITMRNQYEQQLAQEAARSPQGMVNPRAYMEPRLRAWEQEFPRPDSLRARVAPTEGGTGSRRVIDFNQ